MTAERWTRIKEVFQSALDLPERERFQYVRKTCGDDVELTAAVDDLLRSADTDFLAGGAIGYVPGALEEQAWDRYIGRTIGAWVVVRQIGEGGMGAVYLARRASDFEQEAALKILPVGMDSRGFVARFLQERQILAGLDHPNIARLLDGGATEEGQPWFAMEYIPGEPIDVYATKHDLGIKERLRLFQQACSAVQYAHQRLVVHRDIKPANILVTDGGIPKLLDFGIARLVSTGARKTAPGLTEIGIRLMTPEYASPEQIRGDPASTATDVYSLGAVLYQLLTCAMPYDVADRTTAEIERVICEQDPPLPSQVVEGPAARELRGDVDCIVLKALRKDILQRYGSVEQLSADIQRYLDELPIEARPQTLAYRAGRFIQRHRWPVGAAALVAIALAVGMTIAAREAEIASRQQARAERHFNDVRQLAQTVLFDFHDAIQNLPGSTPARKLLVEKALLYLNKLSQETANDSSLERELVEAYLRVADVQGSPGVSNLGDSVGALDSYTRALKISVTAAKREPQVLAWQLDQAKAQTGIGDVLGSRNDPSAALPHYREAVRTFESISPRIREDLPSQFDMANAWLALGDCLGNPGLPNVGEWQEAKAAYQKARDINAAVAAAHHDNQRARRNIGLMEMRIADVEMGSGNTAAALARYQNAAKILEGAAANDPLNSRTALILGNTAVKMGAALEALGETKAALGQYRRASDIQRKLMNEDPRNEQFANSYAESLRAEAGMLSQTGDIGGAVAVTGKTLDVFRKLLATDPQSPRRQALYAQTLAEAGELAAMKSNRAQGSAAHREALNILQSLTQRGSASLDDLAWYAGHLLTCRLTEFRDPNRAISVSQKAVAITHASEPLYLEQLAQAYWASGDRSNARATEQKALSLWPESSLQKRRARLLLAKFESAAR